MENLVFSDKYAVENEIARGGMGVVYKAVHTALNRTVALKVLHSQYSGDPSFVQRFLREARAMARLDHNHIIRVFDVAEDGGHHYIVMEYFPATDLKRVILSQSKLSLTEVLSIAEQIAEGLAYAHIHGIVHRDIKPGNVMVNDAGHVKIADFGIAAAADEISVTATGQVLGTPEYMSPEQARGEELDGRCDLYSLGIVMYELLNGRTPFPAISKMAIVGKLLYEEDEFALEFAPDVPAPVRDLVALLMRKKREDRPADAETVIAQLQQMQAALADGSLEVPEAAPADLGEATVILDKPTPESLGRSATGAMTGTGSVRRTGAMASGGTTGAMGARAPSGPAPVVGTREAPTLFGFPKMPALIGAGAAGVVLVLGIAYFALSGGEPAPETRIVQASPAAPQAPPPATAAAVPAPQAPAGPPPELVAEVDGLDRDLSDLSTQVASARAAADEVEAGTHAAEVFDDASRAATAGRDRLQSARASKAGGSYEDARARMQESRTLLAAALDGFGKAREDALAYIDDQRAAEDARRKAREQRLADARKAEAAKRAAAPKAAPPAPQSDESSDLAMVSPGKPDIEVVGEMLAVFKTAYEHRDMATLQEVSQLSRTRRKFLEEIFATYPTIEVKISGFNMVQNTATAVVTIERLQGTDGNTVIPSAKWRAADLTIQKSAGRWRKIVW